MTVAQLVGMAARHGFAVARTDDGVKLCPKRPDARCPEWLIDKLREGRADIIRWLDRSATPDVPNEPRPDTVVTDPNPPAPRPTAGPTVCPTCDADIYPAATKADLAQLCDRTPCHHLSPRLWRGSPTGSGPNTLGSRRAMNSVGSTGGGR